MKKNFVVIACLLLSFTLCCSALAQTPAAVVSGADTVTIARKEYEELKKQNEELKKYALVEEVRQYVSQYYYEKPDEQKMLDGAVNGLLSGLGDSYSFYYPEKAWNELWEDDKGEYAGIGVQMLGDYDTAAVTVTRVFRDTPAEKAGIKKGDVFYKVEDIEVTTATMQDAVKKMRGKPGETVHAEMYRGGDILKFDVVKADVKVNWIDYKILAGGVGYIMLYDFSGDCADTFAKALKEMTAAGIKSLIVDLRDNPGGWVESGVRIADLFLDKQMLFYTEDRAGKQEKTFTTDGKSDLPLVLLVNGNSASTSEIVSAAMKDYGRATIVGTKTFGKGIIQYVLGLSDKKSGFQFTMAQYFSPKGNKVHKEGVTPDIEVKMPADKKDTLFEFASLDDPQLKAAYDKALQLAAPAVKPAAVR